ncbi:MAG: polyphosphate:AMP phosphotransferase [Methyloprofundus sp.]|nr:polyphosphate:AMP phosphotransferase [Methyloprofundus sp.]
MFEIAELGHHIKKSDFNRQVPELRTELLMLQNQLRSCDFPVIVLISGVDGGGKGEVINLLNEWLDTRYLRTNAFSEPSDEERERPVFWRFWRTFPPKGQVGIYVGSWYSDPLSRRVYQKINDAQLNVELCHIKQLEKELTDDGALIIKCWLHLEKGAQKQRIKSLEKNPDTSWKVTKRDKKHLKMYDDFIEISENVLLKTSTVNSPWLIVDGSDVHYSSLRVGQHISERLTAHIGQQRLQENTQKAIISPSPKPVKLTQQSILNSLDLSLSLNKKDYLKQLAYYQGKLNKLSREFREQKRSVLLVFEGWDAGGKGGAIRRITQAIDARSYQVIPVAAPTDEEKQQHYLWRFWRHVPRAGMTTIYDRSWYGRVLVERVENFASKAEWQRAYSEIVNFEEALTTHGTLVLKFWLHVDKDEQLRRFKEREQISYKKHKITEEDYRNREKWDDYELAINEMISRTSTKTAPWVLVEGNDKYYARIKILKTLCASMELHNKIKPDNPGG